MRRKKLTTDILPSLFDDVTFSVKQTQNTIISMEQNNKTAAVIKWIIEDIITNPLHAAGIVGTIRILREYGAKVEVKDSHIEVEIPLANDINKTVDAIARAFLKYNSGTFANTPLLEQLESIKEEKAKKAQQDNNAGGQKKKQSTGLSLSHKSYYTNLSIDRLKREIKMFLDAIRSKYQPVTEGEYREDDLYTCDLCGHVYNNFRTMVELRGNDNKSRGKFSDMIKRASVLPSYGKIFFFSASSFPNAVYGIDAENSNRYLCLSCGFIMLSIPAAFTKVVLKDSSKSDYIFIYAGSLIETYRINKSLQGHKGNWIESLLFQGDADSKYMTIFRKTPGVDRPYPHLIDRTQLRKLTALCKEKWFKEELLRQRDLLEICLSGETYRLIDKALDMFWKDISDRKKIVNKEIYKMLKIHEFVLENLLNDDSTNKKHSYEKYIKFGSNDLKRKASFCASVKGKIFTLLRHIRKCNTSDFFISMLDIIVRSFGKVDMTFGLFCQEFIDCGDEAMKAEIFQRSALALLYGVLLQEDENSAEVAEKSVPSKKLK